jgi:hypothetical protein
MPELRRDVLDEAGQRSKYLTATELLEVIERYHDENEPGIARETFEAYAEGVAEETARSADEFTEGLSNSLTDDDGWVEPSVIYELDDGRVSTYPADWHERLGGEGDPREHLRFLVEEVEGYENSVDEAALLHLTSVVGGVGYETAKARLESLRDEGKIVEGADQHPDANVYLPDEERNITEDKDIH